MTMPDLKSGGSLWPRGRPAKARGITPPRFGGLTTAAKTLVMLAAATMLMATTGCPADESAGKARQRSDGGQSSAKDDRSADKAPPQPRTNTVATPSGSTKVGGLGLFDDYTDAIISQTGPKGSGASQGRGGGAKTGGSSGSPDEIDNPLPALPTLGVVRKTLEAQGGGAIAKGIDQAVGAAKSSSGPPASPWSTYSPKSATKSDETKSGKPALPRPPTPPRPKLSIDQLIAGLRDGDPSVRMRSALELGSRKVEAVPARQALQTAARDPNELVRTAAETALRQIPNP